MTRAEEIRQEQDNIVKERIKACEGCDKYKVGCTEFKDCVIWNHEQQQIHELENERKMLNGPQPPTFVTIDEFIEICKNTYLNHYQSQINELEKERGMLNGPQQPTLPLKLEIYPYKD